MNTSEIRHQINQYLERSSFARIYLAADFLAYLADKESEEATQELLDVPGFIESFERGKKDVAEDRVVNWRNIRSDVERCFICPSGTDLSISKPSSS